MLVITGIILAPMVPGLWWVVVLWTVVSALMLRPRVAFEDAALRGQSIFTTSLLNMRHAPRKGTYRP